MLCIDVELRWGKRRLRIRISIRKSFPDRPRRAANATRREPDLFNKFPSPRLYTRT